LRRAKNRFLRGMIFARDSQTGMARIYGSLLATGLTIEDIEAWPDRVRAVTADAVKNAAQRYLVSSAHVTGYLLPQGADQ
jgi:zinc protease